MTAVSHADAAPTLRVEPLPPGTRLLHIGIPKTGTTSLQRGAAYNREELLRHGVCYPGKTMNHRQAVSALMSRSLGWKNAGEHTPSFGVWRRIQQEVENTSAPRSLISHEFACESTDDQARRFLAALGPQAHVVITLRGFADLLGSSWQQYVKAGYQKPFGEWLRAILGKRSTLKTTPTFYKRNDQATIVRRWVRIAGADRVTVVIADKRNPDQLVTAFQDLLDIPPGLLTAPSVGGYAANRSLSAPEAELVLRINKVLRAEGFTWDRYSDLMRHGLIARIQENRTPEPGEQLLNLPEWAVNRALRRARRYADAVAASGCRVVGDLSALTAPVRSVPRLQRPSEIPIDVAFEGIAGLLSAEDGRGGFFDHPPEGVQARKNAGKHLGRVAERSGRDTANAVRATRHFDDRTIASIMGYRAMVSAGAATRRYRRRAQKLIKKGKRNLRRKLR